MPNVSVLLDVAWPAFLARSDLLYTWNASTAAPTSYYEAPFVGNANLGAMLWFEANGTA